MKLRDLPKFKKEVQSFASKYRDSYFSIARELSSLGLSTMEGMPSGELNDLIFERRSHFIRDINNGLYNQDSKASEAKELLKEVDSLYSSLIQEVESHG